MVSKGPSYRQRDRRDTAFGLDFAALVARASKGVDKAEAEILKQIGKAAGVTADRVRDIVKKASYEK